MTCFHSLTLPLLLLSSQALYPLKNDFLIYPGQASPVLTHALPLFLELLLPAFLSALYIIIW